MIGCSLGDWPLKYLGLFLGGRPKSTTFWDPVVEKVSKKLACWKKSYISLGGLITFIKGALVNVPVYYMSLFKCRGRWWGKKRPLAKVGGRH